MTGGNCHKHGPYYPAYPGCPECHANNRMEDTNATKDSQITFWKARAERAEAVIRAQDACNAAWDDMHKHSTEELQSLEDAVKATRAAYDTAKES